MLRGLGYSGAMRLNAPKLLVLSVSFLLSCGGLAPEPRIPPPPPMPAPEPAPVDFTAASAPSHDAAFDALATEFLDKYLELNPVKATELGDHRFDARWPSFDANAEKQQRDFIASTREKLAKIDQAALADKARIDRAVLLNRLDLWTLELDSLRRWVRDPVLYTTMVGDGLDPLITRDFAPHAERMQNLRQRLETLPVLLAQAKASLQHPSKVATETAIQQNKGLIALVDKGLAADFDKEPSQRDALQAAAAKALSALRDFGTFLDKDLLVRSDGDFRIGRDAFRKKLTYYLESETPPDQLYSEAQDLLEATVQQMASTALELWPELFPKTEKPQVKTDADRAKLIRKVLDKLAEDRPSNDTIVAEAKKITADATAFVREKNLVGIPDEPLRVIEMPEYRRGVAVAYCDSSGPLEHKRETFFAISPTPKDWPGRRAVSFYREYNRSMLADLAIHEAMPGHFLQIGHAALFKSPIRAAFESGPFVEGWAVYGEWLMAKYGFGGPRVRMQRLKMVLRLCANAIIDHDIHAGQMTREAALKLMMEQAFQEEGEAAGKWKRAQLTSAQLTTYFYGFHELMKIRTRAEKEPAFNERAFNDKLLSFGSPPPKYLAHLMFGDAMP